MEKYITVEEVIVDGIIVLCDSKYVECLRSQKFLTEHNCYRKIPGTCYEYRIDHANTNTKTQKHIHVYINGNEIYAINFDGTPHDGRKAKLSKRECKFFKSIGCDVPNDGILEWYSFGDQRELLCD